VAEETEPEYDEHVWTSPKKAVKITQDITDTGCALDVDNEAVATHGGEAVVAQT
jgi:ABC-type Zn uptake system ZnuABC Zn-binding protein ZnuA